MPDVEPGYIYALINHSMPGVVRVGMTTRSPEERAVELSPPTGAPFIVAFDVLLHDAAAGEAMLLERLGDGTEGESREFFEIPLREVIRSMLIIRDQMASSGMLRSAPTVPDPAPEERAGHWDELVRAAAELCIQNGGGSTKLLQRRLGLSFAQAARIIDQLSDTGVIGPADGRKERAVLVTPAELDQIVGPH